jgi:uncharacterized protein involved in exopolysaccharide biosynthesis
MGMLPEQMQNNYAIVSQLERQLDSLNTKLRQAEDRRLLVQNELSRLEAVEADARRTAAVATTSGGEPISLDLDQLREQLEALRSRYSDQHPDVLRIAAAIAKLEKKEETGTSSAPQGLSSDLRGLTEGQKLFLVQRKGLLRQMELMEKDIRATREEVREVDSQIKDYRKRIEEGPRIEQLFQELNRGYEETYKNYQSILKNRMGAELATNLEEEQKSERFWIVEPAYLPLKPYRPKIFVILFVGFNLAGALGIGLAYFREYFDPTFYGSKELEEEFQLPVLASFPVLLTKRARHWSILRGICTTFTLLLMCSTLSYALFLLWKKSFTDMPF